MSAPKFRLVAGRGIGEGRGSQQPIAPSPQPAPQPAEMRLGQEERRSNPSPASIPHQIQSVSNISNQMGPGSNISNQMGPGSNISNQMGPGSNVSSQMGPASPLEGNQSNVPTGDNTQVVSKCVRFFRTLINLAKNTEHANREQTIKRVNGLVTDVIFGNLLPEDFTASLQDTLKSQAQPHLLPFLRKTIPFLRDALRKGTIELEGIEVPPEDPGIEEKVLLPPENLHAQPLPSGPINMIPVTMAVSAPNIPQHTADVEMEEIKQEDDAIHVRALQENALKSALIRPEDVMKKITERMKEACYVEEDVLTLISDAAEYRLREILAELTVLAEHRMDNLRMSMTYAPIDDVKAQIRFLENLDRQQYEQNENREKEALIRMSKGKGVAKENIEKAKEMQRADAEAKRNRDANAAAIAALSSKSTRPKWESITTGGGGGHLMRPKTVRINIRDFHAFANSDTLCARTNIVHKLALGGGTQTESL